MNSNHCCPEPRTRDRRSSRLRRAGGWLIPGAILLAMPKCPACLAAYIALATGLGISFSTATHVRMLILTLCIAALTLLIAKNIAGRFHKLRARER